VLAYICRRALRSGPQFRSPNTKTTPLIAAASNGNVQIVRMLLDRAPNTDVNYADARVATALMMAGRGNSQLSPPF